MLGLQDWMENRKVGVREGKIRKSGRKRREQCRAFTPKKYVKNKLML